MNGFYIKNVYVPSRAITAPMAGFSDIGYRALCKRYGAGLTYTEMVSAKALEYGSDKTKLLLATHPTERPVAVQIFGNDPIVMARVCASPELAKFDIIDINMGCPTPKIVKNGDGSALLGNMEKARQIISACAKATDKPITVKFRLGLDDKHIVATEFAKMCEEAGASAITVHGRTTAQGYSGKSDLEQIKKVASSVNIPVIASGDCVDKASFDHILAYTGAAAVMIGRASIGRSEIFAEVNGQTPKVDKFAQIREHIELLKTVYPDKVVALSMRGIICHYLKNISGTTLAKVQISKMTTTAEMLEYLKNFFKTQKGQ